jgi:protein-L-isoaspartate(D-aspartate) O-methyltransferase
MTSLRDEDDRIHRAELVLALRSRGVRDTRTLRAIETVPRSAFVRAEHAGVAYADRALPIACGQTLEPPSHIASVTDALGVTDRDTVLEVGAGTGYLTAILSRLARRVVSIERWRGLASAAEGRLARLGGVSNVTILVGDGALGRAMQAPFDRIVISAAVLGPPSALLNQLAVGGIMIAPVGRAGAEQRVTRFVKREGGRLDESTIGAIRLPALVAGKALAL